MQYARWAGEKEIKERLCPIKLNEQIQRTVLPLSYQDNTLYMDRAATPT